MRYAVTYQEPDGTISIYTHNHVTVRGAKVRLKDAWRTYGKSNCGIVKYDNDVCGLREDKILSAIWRGEFEWVSL